MPNDRPRSGMLTAGGVLAIVGGALGIIVAIIVIATLAWVAAKPEYVLTGLGYSYIALAIVAIIAGWVAIVGGRRALAKTSYNWAIAGGIGALLCSGLLGLLSLIFIATTKREFQ